MIFEHKLLRIGLTGGIGSGKSTVAQMLVNRGAAVIDADAISRSLTGPLGLAMPDIAREFGPEFTNTDGSLNREHMRLHVFNQPAIKHKLETIIHPLVAQETQRQAQIAVAQGFKTLIFDIPLLVESGNRWRRQVDVVFVVDCSEETQIQRVIARNNLQRETVQKIIQAQASRTQRLAAADWVIYNETPSLEMLRDQLNDIPILPS